MHLNSAGSATYGFATVAVDGAIPSALSGVSGGGFQGPAWFTDSQIFYQNYSVSPIQMQTYDVGTHAIVHVGSLGANFLAAGGGVWAKYLSGQGVTTSVGAIGPFPLGSLADVSPDGEVAVFTANGSTGLTVYSAAGTTLLSLPSIVCVSPQQVKIRGHVMAYQTSTGWHLVNVLTGATPFWYPRADVGVVVPVLIGSALYVVEAGSTLSIRPANSSNGYVLETMPVFFHPDAIQLSAGIARVGYCANSGESVTSLIETDITVKTGANQRGTIVGSAIVFTAGTPFTMTTFTVGPSEGSNLTTAGYPPIQHPLDTATQRNLVTPPWEAFFRSLNQSVTTVSAAVQAIPAPTAPAPSFGAVLSDGTTPVQALSPNDTLTLTSLDGSLVFVANVTSRSIDFHVVGSEQIGLVPMTTGAIPGEILFIGGDVMLING